MRPDPDHHDDLDTEVVSSNRPRIRTSSPPASSTAPGGGRCQSPVSNQTPLLTATLNAPPQAYYGGLNGNVRVKCPTDATVSITTKNNKSDADTHYAESHSNHSPSQGLSIHTSHHQSSSVFYSALLKQLRHKAGDNPTSVSGSVQQVHVVPVKIKKEKGSGSLKSLPFMCPACKKRFQRHIAMNAHFQNEHISAPTSTSGERSCKLCGHTSGSLAQVRSHLKTSHNIDLDNPAKCLVEDPPRFSLLEASLRSGSSPDTEAEPSCSNIDMSIESRSNSPQPAHSHSGHTPSSSEQSPERSLFPIKQHHHDHLLRDDDNPQVEDLSVRRPAPVQPECYSPAPRSPRPESPIAFPGNKAAKRPRVSGSPSPTFNHVPQIPSSPPPQKRQFECHHCNISYPNQTLYFLHKGFHSDANPWRCNGCGYQASDLYDFNSHLFSVAHQ